MSMHIVGFKSNNAVPYAIKLGVALQMTNILRDIGEDYRNGRLYLPREELVFYAIHESNIAQGCITDSWRQFMKFQIDRTRQLYAESWAGVQMLEREGQLAGTLSGRDQQMLANRHVRRRRNPSWPHCS